MTSIGIGTSFSHNNPTGITLTTQQSFVFLGMTNNNTNGCSNDENSNIDTNLINSSRSTSFSGLPD